MYKLHISNNAALLKTAKNNLDSSPKKFCYISRNRI